MISSTEWYISHYQHTKTSLQSPYTPKHDTHNNTPKGASPTLDLPRGPPGAQARGATRRGPMLETTVHGTHHAQKRLAELAHHQGLLSARGATTGHNHDDDSDNQHHLPPGNCNTKCGFWARQVGHTAQTALLGVSAPPHISVFTAREQSLELCDTKEMVLLKTVLMMATWNYLWKTRILFRH